MKKLLADKVIYLLVFSSGLAALSWEVLWQIKSSLALGVSAWGSALTLAITMGGMSIGALLAGHVLKNRTVRNPARIYAALEAAIGVAGICLLGAFSTLEKFDSWVYAHSPNNATLAYILGIVVTLGVPTIAMGATLPVLGLMARQVRSSIAVFYGLNTLGAATGTIIAAFAVIPLFGLNTAIYTIAGINFLVAAIAWTIKAPASAGEKKKVSSSARLYPPLSFVAAALIIFISGFATFALEVSWFRSLTGAFLSTTDAFAIMLACVLLALGTSPSFVPLLKKSKSLGTIMAWAGIFILLATPVIERFDYIVDIESKAPVLLFLQWFMLSLWVIGAPVLLLGVALPWVLDDQDNPRQWGLLYGINTMAAIAGSLCAGWVLLPTIGFARTAWLIGFIVAATGLWLTPASQRVKLGGMALVALAVAVFFESGVGRLRATGSHRLKSEQTHHILQSIEGPDATLTAVEYEDGGRALFIDGFVATQQADVGFMHDHIHYMMWMGHLPMAAHPDPKNALVICFGTGQTADAVRDNNPQHLDLVDVNPNIYELAHNFPSNDNVLKDPRTRRIVMDGRAYLRRVSKIYDVITLEPMPPSFAGTNALYAKEFYELARSRLRDSGMVAQWLPFHLISQADSKSISKTFLSVFPNAILWLDPPSKTGILLGSKNNNLDLRDNWPGFERENQAYDLSEKEVRDAVLLDRTALTAYAADGSIITDENQYLSYGKSVHEVRDSDIRGEKHDIMEAFANKQHD